MPGPAKLRSGWLAATALAAGIAAMVLGFSPMAGAADGSGQSPRLVPFGEFIATETGAVSVSRPDGSAVEPGVFAAMKAHVADVYAGVDANAVGGSFVDANDTIFDCIPIAQQPALRGSTAPLPTAPDIPFIAGATAALGPGQKLVTPPSEGQVDRFGNSMICRAGLIPMARVTLGALARFSSLDAYFRKSPDAGALPPVGGVDALYLNRPYAAPPSVTATHRWAHAYQVVNNLGGHSFLNVWDPAIGANQIFSLSQHWYVAGSGSGTQTAEVGLQVYPQFYGTTNPVFFIYWTADDYNRTGCYNLTCAAFVQTSNAWAIGGTVTPWSTLGGTQYEVEVAYYLYQGNWWLYVNGTAAANAIGYFPGKIYKGGALSRYAAEVDYGGEVVGTTSWPPMGSGQFASAGYGKAAYQRSIYYFLTAGGSKNATLTPWQGWASDYTAAVSNLASPWYETLYFGGPGGTQ